MMLWDKISKVSDLKKNVKKLIGSAVVYLYSTYYGVTMTILKIIGFASWTMTFGIRSISINIDRLDNGMDFRGDYCGKKFLASKPYVYWLDPTGFGIHVKVCVAQCPTASNIKICMYNQENTTTVQGFCKITKNLTI